MRYNKYNWIENKKNNNQKIETYKEMHIIKKQNKTLFYYSFKSTELTLLYIFCFTFFYSHFNILN